MGTPRQSNTVRNMRHQASNSGMPCWTPTDAQREGRELVLSVIPRAIAVCQTADPQTVADAARLLALALTVKDVMQSDGVEEGKAKKAEKLLSKVRFAGHPLDAQEREALAEIRSKVSDPAKSSTPPAPNK